ncbi:MAG: histidine phosphatase family protein, partial [Candidatus Wolfebacteria bacterium]|nr:histidine phosphatase family protein [Candidatus Wolfebacteria bacterium]
MNNTFYFLRHAEVEIDKEVPVSSWRLTKEGKRVAYELAEQGIFDDVDMVVASEESKAIETAEPIAKRLGVELTCVAEFG